MVAGLPLLLLLLLLLRLFSGYAIVPRLARLGSTRDGG